MAELTNVSGLVTYTGSGFPTLDTLIVQTIDRDDILPDHKQYLSSMGFVETPILSTDQKFSTKSAPRGMGDLLENGIAPTPPRLFTPSKGIYQIEIGDKYVRTKTFTKWAQQTKTLNGAPGDIQAELLLAASEMRDLVYAYDIRVAEELVKVWTKGYSITASNGAGSATPKGKALFDIHTYGVTGSANAGTFTNFTNGALTFTSSTADILAGTTRLQTLINQLKSARDENGKYVKQDNTYSLYCSRVNEVFWKQVLNNESKFSGQGSNAMQENQFLFGGNKVELVVLDLLGQPGYDGTVIGTTAMIFVTNKAQLTRTAGFRFFRLFPLEIETWKNMDTKSINTDGRGYVGMDHYGAELYISGSTCA